jgi:hypothetical protein
LLIGGSFTSVSGTDRDALAVSTPTAVWMQFQSPWPRSCRSISSAEPRLLGILRSWRHTAIVVQADGRIVVAGYTFTYGMGPAWDIATARSFLFRFHADGTLDSSFAGALEIKAMDSPTSRKPAGDPTGRQVHRLRGAPHISPSTSQTTNRSPG